MPVSAAQKRAEHRYQMARLADQRARGLCVGAVRQERIAAGLPLFWRTWAEFRRSAKASRRRARA